MLNYKSLHPHSLEPHNVKLTLRMFHVNNPATLIILGPKEMTKWHGTAIFIYYVLKFWNIFINVKTTVEGIHKKYQIVTQFVL